jgi:hypothetical protein
MGVRKSYIRLVIRFHIWNLILFHNRRCGDYVTNVKFILRLSNS